MASENVKDDSSDFEVPDFYDEPLLSELELTPLKKGLDLSQNANSTKSCTLPPLDEISEKQNIDSAKDHDLSNILNNNQDLEKLDEADKNEASLDSLLFEDQDEFEPEEIEPSDGQTERNTLPIIEDSRSKDSNDPDDEDELLKLLEDFDSDDDDYEPDNSDDFEIYDDELPEPQSDSVEEPHGLVNSSTEDNNDDDLLSLLDGFDEDDEIESDDSSEENDDTSDENSEIETDDDDELSEDELLAMLSDLEDEDNEESDEDSDDGNVDDEPHDDRDDEDEDDDSDELSEDELLSMLSDLDEDDDDSENEDKNNHEDEDQDIEYTEEDLMNLLQNLDNDSSNKESSPKNNNPYTDNIDDEENEVGDDDDLQNLLEDDFVPPENPFAKPDSEPRKNQNDENDDDSGEDKDKDKNSESLLKKVFYPYIWICEKIYKGIMLLLTALGKIPLLGKIFKALKNLDQIWRIVSYILIPFLILIAFLMMRTPSGTMTDASVEFPDNGSVTMSDYVYLPETDEIQITLTNTGDVIALVKPTIIVDEEQKCSSPKEYLIKSGQEINAKIKCSIEGKNPSFSGLLEWEGN